MLITLLGYGKQLDRNLPVINVGSKVNPVYMPAELVEIIPGQPLKRKTNPAESAQMILSACRSPFANATSLTTIGRMCLELDQNPKLVSEPYSFVATPNTNE